jgi:hypothetical protein
MQFNFLLYIPLLTFSFLSLQASHSKGKEGEKKRTCELFCVVTLAKSGSHLILKAITEITGLQSVWVSSGNSQVSRFQSHNQYPWTHFCISPLLQSHILNRKVIMMVRDLRDLCISATHALNVEIVEFGKSPKICLPNFIYLPFADQLTCVMSEECQMQPEDQALIWNFSRSFPQAVALAKDPRVLVCRYEDLVGPEGGGSADAQLYEIKKIANYIGISLNAEEVKRIASVIYGESRTYRKGQINEWKKIFDPDHKALFKMKFAPYLIALGYEEDNKW